MVVDRRAVLGAVGLGAGAAVGVGVGVGVGPVTSASATERSSKRNGIRVATYNIHHGAGPDDVLDLEHVAEVIAAVDADVVALQEVDRHFRERSDFEDQARRLGRLLDMRHTFGANIDQDPLEPGQPRRQYGTAFLSRWSILSSHNTLLPKYPDSEQRGLLEVVVNVDGRPVRLGNTHMQHTSDAEWQEQADAIVGLLAQSAEPVVFAGDTNAVPDFAGMTTFTNEYVDIWAEVGIGEGLTTSEWRFDYIFVPKGSDVRHAWLVCSDASDHQPLVVDVVL